MGGSLKSGVQESASREDSGENGLENDVPPNGCQWERRNYSLAWQGGGGESEQERRATPRLRAGGGRFRCTSPILVFLYGFFLPVFATLHNAPTVTTPLSAAIRSEKEKRMCLASSCCALLSVFHVGKLMVKEKARASPNNQIPSHCPFGFTHQRVRQMAKRNNMRITETYPGEHDLDSCVSTVDTSCHFDDGMPAW